MDKSGAGKALQYIMTQKYIALALHPETWVDMRRMDYDSLIYPGLVQPQFLNPIFGPGEWIRAMVYEYNEENRNPENIPDNTPAVRLKTPVWWDVAE
ncbi:MAG: SusD/RagB family nutrient-binding outer membrane lipoprotein [Bacteroidales bacterium]|nr:SusD/RagB family nutrient-binding outer membrane lipoprotein [Bacteroidales bacterium]MCF8406186.1 SusD/RagB family nutrient-binding outer membrane lipoprotein [Bacteroidales bacterium]